MEGGDGERFLSVEREKESDSKEGEDWISDTRALSGRKEGRRAFICWGRKIVIKRKSDSYSGITQDHVGDKIVTVRPRIHAHRLHILVDFLCAAAAFFGG